MEERDENASSLQDEITLLQAMYPDELHFNDKTQDIIYTSSSHATLNIRLPSLYPASNALPDLISVTGPPPQKFDLRNQYREALRDAHLVPGDPVLDAMINVFHELLESSALHAEADPRSGDTQEALNGVSNPDGSQFLTVVIWLHHLLATSKRKQALDPPRSAHGFVSGLTKPGYPGLMIFSGPAAEVEEQVQALKGLNWQAFQVRYEEAERWEFKHGEGMKEVETMGEVVEEIGEERKEVFMEAMRMK